MRSHVSLVLVLLGVGVGPAIAAVVDAEPPLVGDRPDFTESAVTVPRGSVQHELGVTHAREDDLEATVAGEWLVRWGVVRNLELRLGLPSWAREEAPGAAADGWTDGLVGLKWHSQDGRGPRPAAALLVGTTVPVGSGRFGEDTLRPEVAIAMEWSLGARVGLGANVGYRYASQDLLRYDQWRASLSLGLDLGAGLGCFVEGFGFSRLRPDGDRQGFLDAGLTWRVATTWQLDVRGGLGRNGRAEDWFAGAGLVTRYGPS